MVICASLYYYLLKVVAACANLAVAMLIVSIQERSHGGGEE